MSIRPHIQAWYQKAQIDYLHHYMALYAAFNAWYRSVLGTINDRQAITRLRQGNDTWNEYRAGKAMPELLLHMRHLVELTQREPISYASPHWKGEVGHIYDWCSLLEYWYRVRCLVMHGSEVRPVYVYLAYETLNIFMGEIINGESE